MKDENMNAVAVADDKDADGYSNTEWKHKDAWLQRHSTFAVEVVRWEESADSWHGIHRWAVYAYIYPSHPCFPMLNASLGTHQPALEGMPLHGSIMGSICGAGSYSRFHRDEAGTTTSAQIGEDYNHVGDEHFTYMENKDEAWEVFRDAQELATWLLNYADELTDEDRCVNLLEPATRCEHRAALVVHEPYTPASFPMNVCEGCGESLISQGYIKDEKA